MLRWFRSRMLLLLLLLLIYFRLFILQEGLIHLLHVDRPGELPVPDEAPDADLGGDLLLQQL